MSKGRAVVTPGKLSNTIDRMELEEVRGPNGGAKVTVYYKHFYLSEPPTAKAEVFISNAVLAENNGYSPSISDYFMEIGVLFGLEDGGRTVDWQMTKEIDDDYMAAHPECNDPKNIMAIVEAPGRVLWVATDYR